MAKRRKAELPQLREKNNLNIFPLHYSPTSDSIIQGYYYFLKLFDFFSNLVRYLYDAKVGVKVSWNLESLQIILEGEGGASWWCKRHNGGEGMNFNAERVFEESHY